MTGIQEVSPKPAMEEMLTMWPPRFFMWGTRALIVFHTP
jgi:hypothetical protein